MSSRRDFIFLFFINRLILAFLKVATHRKRGVVYETFPAPFRLFPLFPLNEKHGLVKPSYFLIKKLKSNEYIFLEINYFHPIGNYWKNVQTVQIKKKCFKQKQ